MEYKFNEREEALAQWDKEHGDKKEDTSGDIEKCPGCNEPMDENHTHASDIYNDIINQTMHVHVEKEEDGRMGTIVDLPDTKPVAYLFLLSVIETMSLAGRESFDDIIEKVKEMRDKNALQKPISRNK